MLFLLRDFDNSQLFILGYGTVHPFLLHVLHRHTAATAAVVFILHLKYLHLYLPHLTRTAIYFRCLSGCCICVLPGCQIRVIINSLTEKLESSG